MFGLQQETPSRILRQIRANELEDDELPSLPSAPGSAENSLNITDGADKSNASGSSLVVVRRRPRPAVMAMRGILSPLNANRRINNNNDSMDSSPQTVGKGKGRASLDAGADRESPRSQQRQQRQKIPPSTVASAASSARTVRAVSFPVEAKSPSSSSGIASKKEVSFSNDSTREDSSLNLDDSILSPNGKEEEVQIQDDSSLQGLRDLEDSEERSQLESTSQSGTHDADDHPTPVPASSAKFESAGRPLTVLEEQEEQKEDNDEHEDSLPALPSTSSSSSSLSSASPAAIGDTSEERLAQYVVLRRRTNPIIRKAPSRNGVADSPDSAVATTAIAIATPLPATSAAKQDSSLGSTPGIGRRLPSAERRRDSSFSHPEISVSYVQDDNNTPSKTLSSPAVPPSTGTVSSRAYPESNFATPRAASGDADLEKRKSHLLSTLRLTALRSGVKPRLKKGTPHPARRARSLTPLALDESSYPEKEVQQELEEEAEDHTTSSTVSAGTSSSTSSHDLTTHPRGNGNTSLPLTGVAATANTAANRFNGAKLNNYLHTLNTHLSSENQNLVKTLEETAKEVQRLLARNRELSGRRTSDESQGVDGGEEEDGEEAGNRTREMLQEHRKTRKDIEQLREHLTGSSSSPSNGEADAIQRAKDEEHARQLADLQNQLEIRNEEVASLRSQLLSQTSEESTNSHLVPELRQQIFSLQDELTSARLESSSNTSELARLRQEILDSASRNTLAISDLQNRTDELLCQLEEKDGIIEEAEKRLEEQEEGFKEKMEKLEEELCKVMEEQEGQLREARRDVEELKEIQERGIMEKEQQREKMQQAEEAIEELKREKGRMEKLLDEATATTSTASNEGETKVVRERIRLLQAEVAKHHSEVKELNDTLHQAEEDASAAARMASQEIRDLKDDLAEAESRALQAERKLSSSSIALKESSSQLEEAQANLRNADNQITRLTRQVEECQSTISELQREQMNASFAVLESETQKTLEAAQRELGNLKHQLASPSLASTKKGLNADVKDLEIRTLRSSNHELETRVNQLKKQALLQQQSSRANPVQTPLKGAGVLGTPEKSVRFDSVRSMKTPKSVSQMLAGMSFLDKTDANATIAPLYTEIDHLHEQVKHYQAMLQQANADVDDKLQKLNRAGAGTLDLAKELEESRRKVKSLESELRQSAGGGSGQAIIAELRGVKEQLTNERSDLVRRLGDIKQHCHQISSQLDASRSSQADTQRALDVQLAETRKLRQKLESSHGAFSELDSQRQALVDERNSILKGVAALHRDLNKVQKDARDIGDDLKLAKQGEMGIKAPFGSATCNKQACVEQQTRHREEAKGLLVMIKYLKLRFTRESYLRADLAHQKLYLNMVISQKQRIMDATNVTLARFGMPPTPEKKASRRSLKVVANAVLSMVRMKRMSEEWRRQSVVKESLREAYRQTRGKEFPN